MVLRQLRRHEMGLEAEIDKCTWKFLSEDKNSTTFKDVTEGHKLYPCVYCPGTEGSCPDYRSHRKLLEKYGSRNE